MYKILKKEKLNSGVEKMVVLAPYVARKCQPGQFVIVCADEGDERIPLTIQDFDRQAQTISIIYQVVGYSTQKISAKKEGEYLAHFAGPLGVPAHLDGKKILGIGGGVGAAPLYPQIKELHHKGASCDVILGGRSKEFVILHDAFQSVSEVYVATNDGSLGVSGFVTDILKELIESGKSYDQVIAIGPLIMMKAVVAITKPLQIPTMVSLNPVMIDGTGMCGGCRVTIGGETKFACVDGPDFDGFKVDFDECMRRQTMYQPQEKHICNIGLGGGKNA